MTEEESTELDEALESLDFTPTQLMELRGDRPRALGWVRWARTQSLRSPAGMILSRFRTGETPVDPNAWRGTEGDGHGPNYPLLLRCCESLVKHTGHEYREEDLLDEFNRCEAMTKVGGAVLTDSDRSRLMANAASMRSRWKDGVAEREKDMLRSGKRMLETMASKRRGRAKEETAARLARAETASREGEAA